MNYMCFQKGGIDVENVSAGRNGSGTGARPAQPKHSEGKRKTRRLNPRRFVFVLAAAAFMAYFAYVMIWQHITIARKDREIEALEEKISAASQTAERLQTELDNLDDPEYLERVARERLGLIRPNERVFVDANKGESAQNGR